MAEMTSDGSQLGRVITQLKQHIGRHWKAVARKLNFTTTDIDAIEHRDERDLKEQIHRFFDEWKMREGVDASVQKLLEAARAAGLHAILDELQLALPELECGGTSTVPVEETARDAAKTPKRDSELDVIRKKRLEKLSISDKVVGRKRLEKLSTSDPGDPTSPPPLPSSFPSDVKQTVSTPPGSPTVGKAESSAQKNSGPSTGKAGAASGFEVGQVVKIDHKPKPWYGVIKFIGTIASSQDTIVAGVEMEEVVKGGHSGKFEGKRYFTCEDCYGLFLPPSRLKPDDRFDAEPPSLKGASTTAAGDDDVERDKHMPSAATPPLAPRKVSNPSALDLISGAAKSSLREGDVFESNDGSDDIGCFTFECPGDVAGFVIGKDGKNLRDVESKTGTRIKVDKNEHDKAANTKVIIAGKKENCEKAMVLIVQNIRRKTALHTATTETIEIPNQHCGRVIGRKGANVQAIQNLTGTRINIESQRERGIIDVFLNLEGPAKCEITGSAEQIEEAKKMIELSLEGSDIAGAAYIAAFMIKFIEELKAEGYTFSSSS